MSIFDLFIERLLISNFSGVGISMTEGLYRAPCLSDIHPSVAFAQNLPSIVCGHVTNVQSGQTVLDMCAAPGKIRKTFWKHFENILLGSI